MTNRNVPKLRLKGFKNEWKKRNIKNFVEHNNIKNKDMSITNVESVSNKKGFLKQTDQFDDYSVASKDLSNYIVIKPGMFAYNPSRINVGSIAFKDVNSEPSVVSPLYVSFKTTQDLSNNFFLKWFKTDAFKYQRNKYSEGGVRDTLPFKYLANMDFILPDLSEQHHIDTFFANLDHLIYLHSKKMGLLKKLKCGYLQKMFPQKDETVPHLRFKGFNDDWKEVELGKIGRTFSGLSGKNKKDFGHGNGLYVNYLSINKKDFVDISNTDKVDVNKNEKQNTLKKGDVLFTTSSETPDEVGLSSVWNSDAEAFLNSFSFGFRMTKKFDLYFSGYMFSSLAFRKTIYPLAQGISRYNLSKTNFLKLTIKCPSIDEQEKIGKYLHSLDLLIDEENSRVNELKKQKKAYLQKMFI